MPKVTVYNVEGQAVGEMELSDAVFGAEVNESLLHDAVVRHLANQRQGTADTKTRSEVAGGGRKPWRQKGTGRARQGSNRSPVFARGAKVHTPHPHSYVQDMPKKMRRAALRSALSAKAAEAGIVVVDNLTVSEPKTRIMVRSLNSLVGENTALVLIPTKETYEGVIRSTQNISDAKILLASYLNIRDLMVFDKVVLPLASLDVITQNLG